MFHRFSKSVVCAIAVLCCASNVAQGQDDWYSYQLIPHTVYEKKPVTITTWVDETVNQKKTVNTYKPVWQTETRERIRTSYKPVRKTSEREVKTTVYKPFTETLFREKRTEETEFEIVTEFRDEEYTVREPVIETSMREERVTVRKPVTQKLIEVKKTTTYRPVVKSETQLVPAQIVVPSVVRDPTQRGRMQMLQPGYYTDPVSGISVYRRRGLHWVSPNIPAASVAPALLPVQTGGVRFEPKTVEERKPVEITRYVDEIETRKVPVEVEKMVERVKTRRVPYEMKIPKTKVTIEKIPYTQTTYKEEVVVKKVPFTETTYLKVEETEPYEVEIKKWVAVTREVDVPKVVRRKVERTVMQDVPRTVLMKVPVDCFGNPLANATEVYSPTPKLQWPTAETNAADTVPNVSSAFGSTQARKPSIAAADELPKVKQYTGNVTLESPKTVDETSERKSVLSNEEPSEKPSSLQSINREADVAPAINFAPEVILPAAEMPEELPSETGDEKASERTTNSSDEDDRI